MPQCQIHWATEITRVFCQKGPTRHAYAWQIGPFWQDTLDNTTGNGFEYAVVWWRWWWWRWWWWWWWWCCCSWCQFAVIYQGWYGTAIVIPAMVARWHAPLDCYTSTHVCYLCMVTLSNGNIFRVTGPLCGEFTGHRLIPLTKASDAELWCFLWSAPKQTVG